VDQCVSTGGFGSIPQSQTAPLSLEQGRLFFLQCALAQPHPRAAAVFVDELNAGRFEGPPNDIKRRAARLTCAGFKLMHGYDADARAPGEILLVPSKQSAGRPALTRRDHSGKVPKTADSHNSIKFLLTGLLINILWLRVFYMESTMIPNHDTTPRRRYFIGGSDTRIIMGNDEAALLRLWREKRGEVEPEDLSANLLVQLGLATEELNRRWYETNSGQVITDVQHHVRHPTVRWMGATLDGRIEATGAVFEAKFMLPWSFSEEAATEKHMAQLQHNMWVVASRAAVLSVITGGGKWWRSPPMPIRSTSTSSSRPSGNFGVASRAASPLAYSAPRRRGRASRLFGLSI
jgi:hypothetical protein